MTLSSNLLRIDLASCKALAATQLAFFWIHALTGLPSYRICAWQVLLAPAHAQLALTPASERHRLLAHCKAARRHRSNETRSRHRPPVQRRGEPNAARRVAADAASSVPPC